MNIKLRNLREERKISQAAMAKILNISQPQYQRKEVGEASFTPGELEAIAKLLDVPVDDIKDKDGQTQNNHNQNGGVGQVMYYISGVVDEYKEINQLLKEELREAREENKKLKATIEKMQQKS